MRLLGVPIDRVTRQEVLTRLEHWIEQGQTRLIFYANVDCINQAVLDRRYAKILHEADLVCADGMGVVWASRLTGESLPERVNVGDLIDPFCALAEQNGYRLFLLGGRPGVMERAAEQLRKRHPALQIVGTHHGHFDASRDQEVVERIRQARPHVVLVGMGVPKQEKWIWQYRGSLAVSVLWGVGAALDYYAGLFPRAPTWMRGVGLEWCFRLALEPKRLWRRYLLGNAFFFVRTVALLLIDAVLVTGSWLGAYWIWRGLDQPFGFTLNPIDSYVKALGPLVGMWLLTCASLGLYRRSAAMSALSELSQVIRATGVGMLSMMAVSFLLREFSLGRPVVLLSGVLIFISLSSSRLVTRWLEERLAKRGIGLRRAVIVGTGELAARVKQEIEAWPVGYNVVGFVRDGELTHAIPEAEIVGSITGLSRVIRDQDIQDVFVASQSLSLHQELNFLATQEPSLANVHIVSEELEVFAQRVPLGRVVELPLLSLPSTGAGRWYEVSKRLCDLLLASAGLLVSVPLCAVVLAMLIKMESPGPVLFVQERVGKKGKRFRMYKFRTMCADAPAYDIAPNDLTDPRVTTLGRFLRRWSLDELPQLLNVIRGEMSVVGPRPEMSFLVEQYQPWQQQRLTVAPGLTGLWQVVGRKELPMQSHIEYDLYYVRHRGWLLDLAILLRTVPAVLGRRGAF